MNNFWSGKNVIVTGHTGFKGSWLTLWLNMMGAKVTGISLPAAPDGIFEVCKLSDRCHHIEGDIRNREFIIESFNVAKPEILFHLASQPLVRRSYQDPVETYSTNLMGLVNVMEACKISNTLRSIVVVTSDKCYENNEWVWGYREHDKLGGFDPYSGSKACQEIIAQNYRQSFFQNQNIGLATARAGNVIGGGDVCEDRLVPDIFRAFNQGKKVVIRNPLATRPWQHVLEPLNGYLVLAKSLFNGDGETEGSWNFGPLPKDIKSVEWVVNTMVDLWADCEGWSLEEGAQPHEAKNLSLEISKALTGLDWKPRLDAGEAIEWTYLWETAKTNGNEMISFTSNQIAQFSDIERDIL